MRCRSLSIVIIALVALASPVLAENPYGDVRVSLNARQLKAEARSAAVLGRKFKAIRMSIRGIAGLGSVSVVLNERKLPSAEAFFVRHGVAVKDSQVPVLFKGTLLRKRARDGKTGRTAVAVSIINDTVKLQFSGPQKGTRGANRRVYTIRWTLGESDSVRAQMGAMPGAAFGSRLCEAHAHRSSHETSLLKAATAPSALNVETFRIVTLSTDADPEWYAKYGESSNAEIAAIVNAAEAIYERQLGIRFALVRQHVYTDSSPYTSTDASKLLASFLKNPENAANLSFSPLTFHQDVDLKHLFTGKDLDGKTIGLSYLGAICWAAESAYGLTQNLNRVLNVSTFAHEIGHSLGAQHDLSDPRGLMFPSLSGQGYLSPTSVSQINRFLSFMGKCVSEEVLRPNLSNAKLTLKRRVARKSKSVRLYGTLTSASQKPMAGEVIKLTINSRVKRVVTNGTGSYTYTLKLSRVRAKKLLVFAQTEGNETSIPAAIRIGTRA